MSEPDEPRDEPRDAQGTTPPARPDVNSGSATAAQPGPPPRAKSRPLSHQPPPPLGDPTGQVFVVEDESTGPDDADGSSDSDQRPSILRSATVVSGRIVLGIVVLAILGVVFGAADLIPLPAPNSRAVSAVVTPVPAAQQVVCPGGLLRLGTSLGENATSASSIGTPSISSGAVPGDVIPSLFTTSDAGTGSRAGAPVLLRTPAVTAGSAAALLGGAQSESVATIEFAGLASAACAAASGDEWLSGGSTSTGRTTLLLLANPTKVVSTVSIQVFGETGAVTAPGMDGIVVAPGSQRVLSIAGFAPGLVSPVVHVTSTGGQVVAHLEQSTVRGLTPGGVDFVGAQAQPERAIVIPGVVVSGTDAIQAVIGQSGYEDLQSTLRVYVPGTRDATVTITILAEDGTVTGKPTKAQVHAGTVNDLDLDSLSDGNYTILVSSTVPIVSSARVSTAGSSAVNGATDFAWSTTAPLLVSNTVVSIASGMTPTLHLYNPTAATETLRVRALGGTTATATVKPGSATTVPVTAGATYELEGLTNLYASVSGRTDGGVTSYAVYPSEHGTAPVRVYG